MTPLDNKLGRGVLFKERDKKNPKGPDHTGSINVNGEQYELAAWEEVSKRGLPYLSIRLQPRRERSAA